MFPYDYLAEFSVVARTGSLSRAALELSLSHSSLSRHIRTLETILGVTLSRAPPRGSSSPRTAVTWPTGPTTS